MGVALGSEFHLETRVNERVFLKLAFTAILKCNDMRTFYLFSETGEMKSFSEKGNHL